MDVTRLIFVICCVSPLEINAMFRSKVLIVSPLSVTMTVLTIGPHYFLLQLLHCCSFVA